jgi:transcriptional regulator with XRE-family HTH domain
MSSPGENRQHRYAELVGDKLRKLRQERGLSLQEVCDRSGGSFVVSTLSAYERGKRSLSLERLLELSDIYGISPPVLLDVEGNGDMQGSLGRSAPLRVNLENLSKLSSGERRPLENYIQFLKNLRNDPAREILTMRKDDLDYLATLYGVRPQMLKDRLVSMGVIEASGS